MLLKEHIKFIFLAIIIIFLAGCNNDDDSSYSTSYKHECIPPQNPYNDGTGHYAGFEWAQANSGTCDGNSESFNEGCEEYYNQEDEYDKCIYHKK